MLKAKIISSGGTAAESQGLTTNRYKGMMGISISNHYFSNERVMGIVQLGRELCSEFVIVIFDYPERWNWPLKQNVGQEENEKRCLVIGIEKKSAYTRELKKLNIEKEVQILTWQDILDHPAYKRNLAALYEEFSNDRGFHSSLITQMETNLSVRLENGSLSKADILTMSNYLLEEIAGLFYLQFDMNYQLDLYPKAQMQIVQDIYDDKYPSLSQKMGYDWSKQGWIEVGY